MTKNLTAASVDKITAFPDKRREIPDGLLPGLYLVVQPSGKKGWAVRYRAGGKTRKLTLGAYPALGLVEAREGARAALQAKQKGSDPASDKQMEKRVAKQRGVGDRDSFHAVARLFLDRYAKPKNRSWDQTARILGLVHSGETAKAADDVKSFVASKTSPLAAWSKRSVKEIARRDVIQLLDDMVDEGKPVAANRMLAALHKMFGWALEREIVDSNPAAGIKAPAAETKRDRVLSDDELKLVWRASQEIGVFGPMVRALMLTGQRRDEVAGMSFKEIDFAQKIWTIPRRRAKNDKAHDVPLSAAMIDLLGDVQRIAGAPQLVFTTNGQTPVSGYAKAKSSLDEQILKILQKAAEESGDDPAAVGLERWTFHDLRRTAASGMARLGINLPVIEKVLNHQSGSFAGIVGVYQRHSYADEKRRALEAWASFVTTLVSDEPKGNVLPMRAGR